MDRHPLEAAFQSPRRHDDYFWFDSQAKKRDDGNQCGAILPIMRKGKKNEEELHSENPLFNCQLPSACRRDCRKLDYSRFKDAGCSFAVGVIYPPTSERGFWLPSNHTASASSPLPDSRNSQNQQVTLSVTRLLVSCKGILSSIRVVRGFKC